MIKSILRADVDLAKNNYLLSPNVLLLLLQDGSARLLDLGGNFYALSQIGAQMLNETLTVGTATAAVRIATEYHAELSQVQNDLHAFLHKLEEDRLISHIQRSQRALLSKEILPSLALMPLLRCISIWPASLERRTWALLALASLSIRLFGWPRTITIWRRYWQKPASSEATIGLEQSVREIDKIVRTAAAHHPFYVECKERALCCWWIMHSVGFSAKLVLGVNLFPLECHCWCEMGQFVLSDDQDWCETFIPVLSYE